MCIYANVNMLTCVHRSFVNNQSFSNDISWVEAFRSFNEVRLPITVQTAGKYCYTLRIII